MDSNAANDDSLSKNGQLNLFSSSHTCSSPMIPSPCLPLEAWGRRLMAHAAAWADRGQWRRYGYEFLRCGLGQGWACLFGGAMLVLLVGTHLLWPVIWPEDRAAYRVE